MRPHDRAPDPRWDRTTEGPRRLSPTVSGPGRPDQTAGRPWGPGPAAGRRWGPGRAAGRARGLDPAAGVPRRLDPAAGAPRRLDPAAGARRRGRVGRGWRLYRVAFGIGAGLGLGVLATNVPALGLAVLLAAVAWLVGVRAVRRRAADRRLAIRRDAAPAVLDLLGAALLAGLNPHKAVLRVAERAPEVLHEDLGLAAAVLRLGGTPAAALRAAAERSGLDELRAAAAALEAAQRWGAPPAEALAARAEALRSRARLRAEADAGRAAVRLAFPLVLCFLPAFVLLTVVPTVAGSLRALTP
jgi:tight adherence protein C